MYLGRIITKSKNLKTLDFVAKREDYTEKDDMPTLIIGKENAKKILGDSLSFIDRSPNNNLSWTYMKTENRQYFETDLEEFNQKIIDKIKENFKYTSFDLFRTNFNEIKRLLRFFKSSIRKYVYIDEKELYIYANTNPDKKIVFGISLDELEYVGIKREKIIDKIKSNNTCFTIESDSFIFRETKKYFSNISIYLPYLYFLKTE